MNRLPSRRPIPPLHHHPPLIPGSKLKLATVHGDNFLFSQSWTQTKRRRNFFRRFDRKEKKKKLPGGALSRKKHRRCRRGGKSSVPWNTCIKPGVANKRTNWPLQSSDTVDTWTACQSERTTQEAGRLRAVFFLFFFPRLRWGALGSWV